MKIQTKFSIGDIARLGRLKVKIRQIFIEVRKPLLPLPKPFLSVNNPHIEYGFEIDGKYGKVDESFLTK